MKNYIKPTMDVNEFRAKETVASLADWLAAANSGLSLEGDNALTEANASYYMVS